MRGRISAYLYSEGPAGSAGVAAGATAVLQTVQTMAVQEQASPATTTYARPASPVLLTDLLSSWASNLSQAAPWGAPAGVYSFSYSPTTRRVTLASTNSTAFKPVSVGNCLQMLGLTQSIASWATSWTGADCPLGIAELMAVTVEPAEDGAIVDLSRYRHGRAVATVWGNHQLHRATLYASTADSRTALAAGYLTTGRVRLWQDTTDPDPYGADHPGGYVDGYVLGHTDLRTSGDLEGLWELDLLIGVPR